MSSLLLTLTLLSLPTLLVSYPRPPTKNASSLTWNSETAIESMLEAEAEMRGTSPSSVKNSMVHVEATVLLQRAPFSQETATSVMVDKASNAASTSA